MTAVRLLPRSPSLNAFAERFVRAIKEECLSREVLLGERHLRLLVHEFMEHYHLGRNHQGMGNRVLSGNAPPAVLDAAVRRRKSIGGLLNYYHREAA